MIMAKSVLSLILAVAYMVTLCAFVFLHRHTIPLSKKSNSTQNSFALVELYTSEGCSSCPAADKLLSSIMASETYSKQPVYALAFHVDYWNHLGWKDALSNHDYSERQRLYDEALKADTYTPQMIVNGHDAFIGSDKAEADKVIRNALAQTPTASIQSHITQQDKQHITLHYILSGQYNGCRLYAALTENNIEHRIGNGENNGRTLHHDHVVRSLIPISDKPTSEGDATVYIPVGVNTQESSVILFLQDTRNFSIKTATLSK